MKKYIVAIVLLIVVVGIVVLFEFNNSRSVGQKVFDESTLINEIQNNNSNNSGAMDESVLVSQIVDSTSESPMGEIGWDGEI